MVCSYVWAMVIQAFQRPLICLYKYNWYSPEARLCPQTSLGTTLRLTVLCYTSWSLFWCTEKHNTKHWFIYPTLIHTSPNTHTRVGVWEYTYILDQVNILYITWVNSLSGKTEPWQHTGMYSSITKTWLTKGQVPGVTNCN